MPHLTPTRVSLVAARSSSTDPSLPNRRYADLSERPDSRAREPQQALARLPTSSILRSLFLGAFFSSPVLFTPGFALLNKISTSQSRILDPDKNPILRAIVKPLIYDQFCAGTNQAEIQAKVAQIRALGFSGVVLCYGKEIEIPKGSQPDACVSDAVAPVDEELEWWRRGNLETLDMLSDGDYLGIKLSGAGTRITSSLLHECPPPPAFISAMDTIVQKAITRNCRIWIDSEQQMLQPAIDSWTITLMRKHNRAPDGTAVIYNTLQAYLKASRQKLAHQLQLAHQEGWTLAIKLVRGAYISNDIRSRIWDTKGQTDDCYNGIVRDLLRGDIGGVPANDRFPRLQLFLAGHNPDSVSRASHLIQELQGQGRLRTMPEFGQLQGMADPLGCQLVQHGEDAVRERKGEIKEGGTGMGMEVPRVYKCLTWGSVRECMQYLVRRAVENQGATGAVKDAMPALAGELRRRIGDVMMGRRSWRGGGV
ncbi:4-hydroxy-2-oxoglutarate aldolase [Physcia stellaris]|nr:4-hydroxy-2-oxoglutarate aldolase [Physcia stellaris]